MSELNIYKASAGSGKTFRLTAEFLRLTICENADVGQLLAVTFTNKATAEMKNRILDELRKLEAGEKSDHLPHLVKHKKFEFSGESGVRKQARKVLNRILHSYSRFSVSTIDSFFQKVVRAFARERGLNSGYRIELDTDTFFNDIRDNLVRNLGSDPDLLHWLIDFAGQRIEEGNNWDFRKEIGRIEKEIIKEKFEKLREESQAENTKARLRDYLALLNGMMEAVHDDIRDFGANFNEMIELYGYSLDDFSYGKAGVAGFISNAATKSDDVGYFSGIVTGESKRASNGLSDPGAWIKKSAKTELFSFVEEQLMPMLNSFHDFMKANLVRYFTASAIKKNFQVFGVFSDIAFEMEKVRKEQGIMLIHDTTQLLRSLLTDNDVPFIYEYAGNRYQHLMIDEFQDTSGFQWDCFKPLLENAMASGGYTMIVGDVKQSIYRFRGGDWKLLLSEVQKQLPSHEEALEANWRSSREVISFNNALFHHAAFALQQYFNNQIDDPYIEKVHDDLSGLDIFREMIENAYEECGQHIPDPAFEKGYVKMEFNVEGDKKEEQNEYIAVRIIEMLNELYGAGYKPGDIGILVRNNKEAKLIGNALLEAKSNDALAGEKYNFISPDSLKLDSSAAIRLVIAALKFITDESDNLARSELISEIIQVSKDPGTSMKDHELREGEGLLAWVNEKRNILRTLPLYEAAGEVVGHFGLHENEKEWPFIQSLLDLIHEFSKNNHPEISTFLDWWEEKGENEVLMVPENVEHIRIMTIHKSKGLEFRVVLIPFLNWSLDHTHENIIWCMNQEKPFSVFPFVPVKYGKDLRLSAFIHDYFNEKMAAMLDNFNLLYVAFTRAREVLWCLGKRGKDDAMGNVCDLAIQALNSHFTTQQDVPMTRLHDHWNDENSIFEAGTLEPSPEKKKKPEATPFRIKGIPMTTWRNRISVKKESERFYELFPSDIMEKISHGKFMHELMAGIRVPGDLDTVLDGLYKNQEISKTEKADLRRTLTEILNSPGLKEWFDPEWEVFIESPILSQKGEYKIPDRVLIKDKKAKILDFKFGKRSPSHEKQIMEYARNIEEMGNVVIAAEVFYANDNQIVKVI